MESVEKLSNISSKIGKKVQIKYPGNKMVYLHVSALAKIFRVNLGHGQISFCAETKNSVK